MDRITRGWVAGTIGCIAKSTVNAATNRLGIMGMRNSTVGTDLVLGKALVRRKGVVPWLVGEIASSQLGGFWGTVLGLVTNSSGKNTWVIRGIQVGSLAWMIDMGIGARSIPRAVQGDVSPGDALMWWLQHQVFGLITAYLLDAKPELLDNAVKKISQLSVRRPIPHSAFSTTDAMMVSQNDDLPNDGYASAALGRIE